MENTADTYDEFIEETVLKKICINNFGNNWEDYFLTTKTALWDAFKAGRRYQFDIRHNTK